ncbi:MAG: type I polyketide synthase [Candidatus Bipolaricaulia bacterium]
MMTIFSNRSESTFELSTLVDLLRWRALHQPDQQAYTFLVDGETEEVSLTYGELDRQARAIGAWLQSLEITGERVLLLCPPGLEYIAAFFGCLYAGVVAVPTYPSGLNRLMPRLQAIVADAQARVVLTTTAILSSVKRRFAHAPDLETLRWLAIDNVPAGVEADWQEPAVTRDTLVFLQYTSGSTSMPKGGMVSYGNMMHNLALIRHGFKINPDNPEDVGVFWLPIYHDMGLIGGILEPMYIGRPAILMSPLSFVQRPVRWLQAIARYKGTISGAPNFAYELCVDNITPEQRATLDLSSWDVAFCGAEPIRLETLDRFAATFEPCGFRREAFYPCYGLAEATVMASGGLGPALPVVRTVQRAALEINRVVEASERDEGTQTLVGCGQALLDQKILIVHPEKLTPCLPDQVGEIWVSSPSVAQGYWNRPEEMERTFNAYLSDTGEGPFLRTGDLGFVYDGELFVTGRLKDLIIIRGHNHYPQDIELTVERSHPALRPGCGAAFSVGAAGEERLVIVQEVERHDRNPDIDKVVGVIRQAVAEDHELQVYAVVLIKYGSIPKTSSGKIQRHACRAGFLEGSLNVVGAWRAAVAPRSVSDAQDATVAEASSREPADVPRRSAADIEAWLVSQISGRLGMDPDDIDIHQPFTHYGLDSKHAVRLAGELGAWLGRQLSPTLAYEYPTIEALAQYLAEDPDPTVSASTPEDRVDGGTEKEPIAIIGIGCRFPGANGPDAFWQLLQDGMDAITEVPADRWDIDAFYDPTPDALGKMNTRWGSFLEQVDQFDPHFFGISPREAARIDPQQRILLEVAWEALEDGGQVPDRLAGTRTGVFIGISTNDYGRIQLSDPDLIDAYAGTGNALSIAANRLSYLFDLQGPSAAVDTACSSSLVAVHLACCSLWNGESTLALAGGVNLILSPAITINFTKAGVMAPDGRCKAFDARANGYVRGEGAGLIVLKPLSRALADDDPIYAVIRGSAVNQDGRTNGLMAPSRQAQEAVLREAYRRAGVSPGQVQYIEAHGTGTFLGDPIEAKALGTVLAIDRPPGCDCTIGSVKTNIGHLEAAAGIAGLIKVALSLKHRAIPPSLHFQKPNPHIPFNELPLRVQQILAPWPEASSPALAGVSSFGFGGTNTHMVLEEVPRTPEVHQHEQKPASGRTHLLPLSARSPEALQSLARAYQDLLTAEGSGFVASLQDVCYTASLRRSHHDHRLALVAHSQEEFIEHLEAFLNGESRPGMSSGRKVPGHRRKLVFVFSGQGSQWYGMGRELLEQESVFRTTLEHCDQVMRQYVDWSLLEELTADEAHSRLDEIDVIQPALFAIQVALVALWRSRGIEPDAVVGHSMGEVAAAHVAGALSLEDAVKIICRRSQLLKRTSGQGSMAAVELSLEQAQRALAGYEDRVSIAVSNSPTSTVLSGDPATLEEVLDTLQRQEIFCRLVQVDVAAHSPQIDPLGADLLQALEELQSQPASLPIYSTVTGEASDGLEFDATYWVRNLKEPVLFSAAVQQLLESDHDIFLEISPHPILLKAIQQGLQHLDQEDIVLPSLRRDEEERAVMLGSLGALYTLGHPVDWSRLYPSGGRCVRLPPYPWQRERCWIEGQGRVRRRFFAKGSGSRTSGHPLLGRCLRSAVHSGTYFWEMDLGIDSFPFLDDHRVQGAVVLPVTAYVEMVLAASEEIFGPGPHVLEKVAFKKALFLPEDDTQTVQLVISAEMPGTASFQFFSFQAGNAEQQTSWTLHAIGTIRLGQADADLEASPVEHALPEEIQARCLEVISGAEHYQAMQERGFGLSFQGVEQIWRQDGEAIGRLRLSETVKSEAGAYQIHPALLDACLHVLAATLPREDSQIAEGDTYLPVDLDSLRVYDRPRSDMGLWSHALLRPGVEANANTLEGDVFLLDDNGQLVLKILGLSFQRLDRDTQRAMRKDMSDWLYEIQWEPKTRPKRNHALDSPPSDQRGRWLIFTDSHGVGRTLRSLLEARGESCILVSPGEACEHVDRGCFRIRPEQPEDMRQLLEVVLGSDQPACRGVVHLWSLDAPPPEQTSVASLETAQTLGCGSVLHLIQELARTEWRKSSRLWLVTRGTQPVEEEPVSLGVAQTPLWGFGRTIAQEHPALWGGLVDLDPEAPVRDAAALLLEEIWSPDGEDQLAFRQGQRYVARLVRKRQSAGQTLPPRWRPDSSYLITGGLGDLGRQVARWMVEQGARRLILLGRTKLPPRSSWNQVEKGSRLAHQIATIRELETLGASVHLASVDVADEVQLISFLEAFHREGWPPIRGVMHLAGVAQGKTLLKLDITSLNAVLRPKVVGGWLLYRFLGDDSLDFFVLFSSAASLLGVLGQGAANYAAANAFLDGLVHHRQAQGRPALSINWGPWAEVGMVARHEQAGRLALRGIESIMPDQGLKALGRMLGEGSTQIAIMPVNWPQLCHSFPVASKSPLLSHLVSEEVDSFNSRERPSLTRDVLLDAEPGERQQLLQPYLRDQVARVLGLSASKLDVQQPLNNLGLDSLMAVELKNRIEIDLGVVVPVVNFLQGFSIVQFTKQMLDQLTAVASTPSAPLVGRGDAEQLLAQLDQLSDEEVDSLLSDVLAEEEVDE